MNMFDTDRDGRISWEDLSKPPALPGLSRYRSTEEKESKNRKQNKLATPSTPNLLAVTSAKNPEQQVSNASIVFDSFRHDEGEPDNLFDIGLINFINEFCESNATDLKIGLMNLFIAYNCNCVTTGQITRAEFTAGFTKLRCNTLAEMKTKIAADFAQANRDKKLYTMFFKWVYDYLLDKDSCKKVVDFESAEQCWGSLLMHWPQYPKFAEFIHREDRPEMKFVNRDLWNALYSFSTELRSDLSNVQDMLDCGAWPSVLDDFLVFLQQAENN